MRPFFTPRQQYWSELIRPWSISAQSMAAFCRHKDIHPDLFYAWKHTLNRKQGLYAQILTMGHAHALASFLALWVESDAVSDSQANGITLSMGQIHTHTADQLFLRCLRLQQGPYDPSR